MAAKQTQTREVNRSSVTGKFVTEKFANTHQRTTEHERIRVPAPAPAPRKKGS